MIFQLSCFMAICVLCTLGQLGSTNQTYSQSGPRSRFESNFNKVCSKYPFVAQYLANLENPSQRFFVYVFDEAGVDNGGLGDRLGGLVTAVAYALRTGRTLLISADKSVEEAFEPYHPNNNGRFRWGNNSWSGFSRDHETLHLHNCVNLGIGPICHLDDDVPQKVVRFISNRAYLCRWVTKPELYIKSNLSRLGITPTTDLYEVAGCMLRLAFWPSEKLWEDVDRAQSPLLLDHQSPISYQIGFHFRCGDSSFSAGGEHNPLCYYRPGIPWRGRGAMESPVDLGNCGKELVKSLSPDMQKNALLYIASDSQDSSQQINDTINWPLTIVQGKACHVNLDAGPACKSMTLVHWFTLALSDKIVIQSIIAADSKTHIPPSGFSRFATIYALQQDAPAFGLSCSHGDKLLMSQLNQGNWICDPPA